MGQDAVRTRPQTRGSACRNGPGGCEGPGCRGRSEALSLQENKTSGGTGAAGLAQAGRGEGRLWSADQVTSRAHRQRQDTRSASTAPAAVCARIGLFQGGQGPLVVALPSGLAGQGGLSENVRGRHSCKCTSPTFCLKPRVSPQDSRPGLAGSPLGILWRGAPAQGGGGQGQGRGRREADRNGQRPGEDAVSTRQRAGRGPSLPPAQLSSELRPKETSHLQRPDCRSE